MATILNKCMLLVSTLASNKHPPLSLCEGNDSNKRWAINRTFTVHLDLQNLNTVLIELSSSGH